jgi:drug/metabolite transporter (DMT)-like permease
VYYKEAISVLWVTGIVLLLVGIFAAVGSIDRAKNKGWIVTAVLAMTCSGTVGVLQKLFRIENPNGDIDTFLFTAIGVMLIISLIGMLLVRGRLERDANHEEKPRYYFVFSLALAVSVVFANKLNLFLSGVLPGIIFFPCVNGGCIALSSVASSILFKEKLKLIQWIGVSLSVIAIILIAIK